MAKRKINKSAEIRSVLAENPEMKPSQIAEMLSAKNIKVSAQMVSTIKSKSKPSGQGARKKTSSSGRTFRGWPGAYGDLQDTITYVKAVGGLEKAKQLISLIEAVKSV